MKNGQWIEPAVGRVAVALCCPLPTPFEPSPEPGMAQRTKPASGSILSGARRAAEASVGVGSAAEWLLGLLLACYPFLNSAIDQFRTGAPELFGQVVQSLQQASVDPCACEGSGDAPGHFDHGANVPKIFNRCNPCITKRLVIPSYDMGKISKPKRPTAARLNAVRHAFQGAVTILFVDRYLYDEGERLASKLIGDPIFEESAVLLVSRLCPPAMVEDGLRQAAECLAEDDEFMS